MTIVTLAATFEGSHLDIIIIGNERWARGRQIGGALELASPGKAIQKIYARNAHEFSLDDTMLVELLTSGGMQHTRIFSERGCIKLAMLACTPKAAAFRDWAATMLSNPAPQPLAALPAPALSRAAAQELGRAWLATAQNRKFVRYAKAGLTSGEIMTLCKWASVATVTRKRRAAEALGLIQASPNLAKRQAQAVKLLAYQFKGGRHAA